MNHERDEAELRSKVISGAKWYLGLKLLAQAFSWFVAIYVVRLLTPQDYGLYSMVEVAIELMLLFSTLGIDSALIRHRTLKDGDLSAAFGLLLLVNGLFFLLLLLCSDFIAAYFGHDRIATLLKVNAIIFLLAPFRAIPDALLDRDLAFKLRSQIELVVAVFSALMSLVFAYAGAGVWALVAAQISNYILKALILAVVRPWIVVPSLRIKEISGLIHYGGAIMISGALVVFGGKAVVLLAAPTLGAEVLGYYAVAVQFALLPLSKIMPAINQTMYPAFSRLQDQPETAKVYILKALQVASVLVFPISIGLACLSEPFVILVFGEKWSGLIVPLALLAMLSPLRLISEIFTSPLNAIGKAKSLLTINLIKLMILSIGTMVLMGYGLLWIVLVWYITIIVILILSLKLVRVSFSISIRNISEAVSPAFWASLCMALSVLLVDFIIEDYPSFVRVTAGVICGSSAYILLMFFRFRKVFNEISSNLLHRKLGG